LPTSQLTLLVSGSGTVTPNLNGSTLIVGNAYTVKAVPKTRNLFAGWTGSLATNAARLTFIMQSNLMLQANFVTNQFVAVKGSYLGRFEDGNEIAVESSGAFKATVTEAGSLSGALRTGGKTYPFSALIDLTGHATKQIKFQRTNLLTIDLNLDLTNGTDQIIGTVASSNWTAQLLAYRPPVYSRTHPAPSAGRYTLDVVGGTDASRPRGNGVATIVVATSGALTLAGTLADGTKVAQAAPVSKDGWWPFYAPLYGGKGLASSWLMFTNDPAESITGPFNWIKPPVPRSPLYPAGFTNLTSVSGSTYSAQVMTNRLGTNGHVCVSVAGQNAGCPPLTARRTASGFGVKSLKLDLSTGLWTGSVTNPANGRLLPIKCVFHQRGGLGYGYALDTNSSSAVQLMLMP
jgi:hypothetical protein